MFGFRKLKLSSCMAASLLLLVIVFVVLTNSKGYQRAEADVGADYNAPFYDDEESYATGDLIQSIIAAEDNNNNNALTNEFTFPLENNAVTAVLPYKEMQALQLLYSALNGKGWAWSLRDGIPWNFSTGAPSPCGPQRWDGIKCTCNINRTEFHVNGGYNAYYYHDNYKTTPNTAYCNIAKIYLSKHNLQGTLPTSLFTTFKNLTRLHLGFNSISGTLPVYDATSVHWPDFQLFLLEIAFNQLRGPIPSWVGSLSRLTILNLKNNSLSSTIPSALGQQSSQALSYIAFFSNNINGTIPTTLCKLQRLKALGFGMNKLQSTMPSCIGLLTQLQLLNFRQNMLNGPFPSFINSLTNLYFLGLGGNSFSPSPLSSSLQSLKLVQTLLLYGCGLTGTIPSEFSSLASLIVLRVENNKLIGSVPPFLCNLKNLAFVRMEKNILGGSLPACIGQSKSIQTISLYNNALTGKIPTEIAQMSSLTALLLSSNQLSGNLVGLFDPIVQNNLQFIDVSNNAITGGLTSDIFRLRSLSTMAASLNCMTGTLPSSICAATNLRALFLFGLKLSAKCSSPIVQFDLEESSYQSNVDGSHSLGLIGTLPGCIFALPYISSIVLSGNHLSGSLPVLSGGISRGLVRLSLTHNQFTGTIPLAIQLRSTWQLLDLSFNRLSGTLDQNARFAPTTSLFLSVNRLSGSIPKSLLPLQSIRILEGNYFSCSQDNVLADKSYLPGYDPAVTTTKCGSDEVNLSILVWIAAFGLGTMLYCSRTVKGYILPFKGGSTSESNGLENRVQGIILKTQAHTQSVVGDRGKETSVNERWGALKNSVQYALNLNAHFNRFAGYHVDVFDLSRYTSASYSSPRDEHLQKNVAEFEEIMRSLRWLLLWTTFLLLGVFTPCLFVPLAEYFGSITVQNAWEISAGYKLGLAVAVGLISGFMIFLLFLRLIVTVSLRHRRINRKPAAQITVNPNSTAQPDQDGPSGTPSMPTDMSEMMEIVSLNHRLRLSGILFLNTVVVIGVNIIFVIATLNLNGLALAACAYALSLFKIVFPRMLPKEGLFAYTVHDNTAEKRLNRDRRNLTTQIIICLMNNIVIPCVVTIFLNPNCIRYAFVAPPFVETVYSIPECISYTAARGGGCITYSNASYDLVATPPFDYSFNCSSTLLASYSVVFIYLLITVSFVIPIIGALMILIRRNIPDEDASIGTKRYQFLYDIATLVLTLCGPVYEPYDSPPLHRVRNRVFSLFSSTTNSNQSCCAISGTSSGSLEIRYFKKIEYCVSLFQILCIVVSFGLMFPPLSLMGLVAIFVKSLVMEVMVHQFIADANCDNRHLSCERALATLSENFDNVWELYKQSMWWVFPTCGGFSAFFVFDVLGDDIGASNAIGALVGLLLVPLFIYIVSRVGKNRAAIRFRIQSLLFRMRRAAKVVKPRSTLPSANRSIFTTKRMTSSTNSTLTQTNPDSTTVVNPFHDESGGVTVASSEVEIVASARL